MRVPSNLDLAGAAPLLCAGINRSRELGHMAVKIAHALEAHVVAFTASPNKKDDALRLGADEIVISRNADKVKKARRQF